ncbi:DUF2182 domain-containing protein [Streptomyces sp. SCSIO 30461]|uniref:DUF2182 domain-containing protein n=1 Tax=Streptomyces sp. SCSIO 30461 TaxID=3118085 RepID=UPI0030D3F32B
MAQTDRFRWRADVDSRHLAATWTLFLAVLAGAWIVTVRLAVRMGVGPGIMGMTVIAFVAVWTAMMVAMMLPSVIPVAAAWSIYRERSPSQLLCVMRSGSFTLGFFLVWAVFGFLGYVAFAAAGNAVSEHPESGRWIGSAIYLFAGLYHLSPPVRRCVRHCRNPLDHAFCVHAVDRSRLRSAQAGSRHGGHCVVCCLGLMSIMIPLGMMNLFLLVALTVLIFGELFLTKGVALHNIVGVALIAFSFLAFFGGVLLPGVSPISGGMQ